MALPVLVRGGALASTTRRSSRSRRAMCSGGGGRPSRITAASASARIARASARSSAGRGHSWCSISSSGCSWSSRNCCAISSRWWSRSKSRSSSRGGPRRSRSRSTVEARGRRGGRRGGGLRGGVASEIAPRSDGWRPPRARGAGVPPRPARAYRGVLGEHRAAQSDPRRLLRGGVADARVHAEEVIIEQLREIVRAVRHRGGATPWTTTRRGRGPAHRSDAPKNAPRVFARVSKDDADSSSRALEASRSMVFLARLLVSEFAGMEF